MCNLKYNTNELIKKNRSRLTDIEDKHHYQRGKEERDKEGVWASLVVQMVKNLPNTREAQV